MNRWFRMYDELLDNPKVQRLSGDEFKAWVNILCLASRGEGFVPAVPDIAFALRLDERKAAKIVAALVTAKLLEPADDGRFVPHGWAERQYKSDVSTGRVKRFRERSKQRSETATETPPDTDTDTETETESSVANATGASPPPDPLKIMFDSGIRYLGEHGVPAAKARPLLGRWNRDHGAGQVIEAVGAAQRQGVVDPVGWIEGRWRAEAKRAAGNGEWVSPC